MWGKRFPTQDMVELLLAYRFDKEVGLYRCYPLGEIEETSGCTIGSGSQYAFERIRTDLRETGRIDSPLTASYVVDLINKGLKAADQDIYSKGFDMKIIRPEGVLSFGKEIKRRTEDTRRGLIKHIKERALE